MNDVETQTYQVTVSHGSNSQYGDYYEEHWKVKETGKQFRPNDLPSFGIYDAKTKAPIYLEWTLEQTGDLGRDGHKPSIISLHPKKPYMAWYAQRTITNGKGEKEITRQEIYRAYPKESEVDSKSGTLRHLYHGAVISSLGREPPFELTTPIYDADLTNHPQELPFPK